MAGWAAVSTVSGLAGGVAAASAAPAPVAAAPIAPAPVTQDFAQGQGGAAPAQLAYATPASMSGAGVMATGRSLAMLRQTKPWVRFISIVMLVGAGLMLVVGLIAAATSGNYPQMGVMIFVACIYGAAAYLLSQYASAIGRVLQTNRESDLEAALLSQKTFWKFSGILTLIVIILYAVIFLVAIALGGMRMFR